MQKREYIIVAVMCLVSFSAVGGLAYLGYNTLIKPINTEINSLSGTEMSDPTPDPTLAAQDLRDEIKKHPNDREARYVLAYNLYSTGDKAGGNEIFEHLETTNDDWGREAKKHLMLSGVQQ
jgi:hypothetical protein